MLHLNPPFPIAHMAIANRCFPKRDMLPAACCLFNIARAFTMFINFGGELVATYFCCRCLGVASFGQRQRSRCDASRSQRKTSAELLLRNLPTTLLPVSCYPYISGYIYRAVHFLAELFCTLHLSTYPRTAAKVESTEKCG